ncbi:acyltransferase family protein [Streptomyces sp. QTS137]
MTAELAPQPSTPDLPPPAPDTHTHTGRRTAGGRLQSLTGLRFIAAFLVLIGHAAYVPVFTDAATYEYFHAHGLNLGYLGVSVFFVLSGFVLTWVAKAGDPAKSFWRRRAVKILPTHVVVFGFGIVFLLAQGLPVKPLEAAATLLLVQAWLPDSSFVIHSVNGITWSISVELAFYTVFPLLIVWIRRIRPERLVHWFTAVAVAALAVPVFSSLFLAGPDSPVLPGLSWAQLWVGYFSPPVRGLELVAGMLTARLISEGRWTLRVGVLPASLAVAGVYVLTLFLPVVYGFGAFFAVPVAALVAALATRDIQDRGSWLGRRPMVWLGEAAYGFCLVNLILLFTIHIVLGRPVMGTAAAVLYHLGTGLVCVVVARLLYVLVEMPATRRWGRKPDAEQRKPKDAAASGRV